MNPKIFFTILCLAGCSVTQFAPESSTLGTPTTVDALPALAATPGPVTVESVVSADWEVPRSGVLNLEHPEAVKAGLVDDAEPIHIPFHVLRHPKHGTFLIDTGVERAWGDPEGEPAISSMVQMAMNTDALKVRKALATWLEETNEVIAGVFITHLHLDHVMGLPDLPKDVPLYVGPSETDYDGWQAWFLRGSMDELLEGRALREWSFRDDGGDIRGAIDIFGDQSVFALWVPGHTDGHVAFLVRSTEGPVLFTGDASHTAWGWQHEVEPGSYNYDGGRAARSLGGLKSLAAKAKITHVVPGHQFLPADASPDGL